VTEIRSRGATSATGTELGAHAVACDAAGGVGGAA
jgi:hypothetical protein